MERTQRSLFVVVLSAAWLLASCTSPLLSDSELNRLLSDEALTGDLEDLLTSVRATPGVKSHKGPVRVDIRVWSTYSGDGPVPQAVDDPKLKRKSGEIFAIWYYTGEEDLAKILNKEAVHSSATAYDPNAPPLFREEFVVYPADKDLEVRIKVYDQDRIGDQKAAEVRKFLDSAGAQAKNLYPKHETLIPVIQELGRLLGQWSRHSKGRRTDRRRNWLSRTGSADPTDPE